MKEQTPTEHPHPGQALLSELEDLGFSQAGFARYIGVPPEAVVELCKKQAPITATLACKIGRALGTTPMQWLELQLNYDLAQVDKDEYEHIKQLGAES